MREARENGSARQTGVGLAPPTIGFRLHCAPPTRSARLGGVIRRYALAPVRCLVLVGLAAAGAIVALVAGVVVALVVTYPAAVAATKAMASLGRRLAREWGGVEVAEEYLPGPPAPQPRADGWYVHDNLLFRSPRVAGFLAKTTTISKDPAILRDWLWLALMPITGGVAVLVPPGLVAAGVAIASGRAITAGWATALPGWLGAPAGLVLVVLGFALGPAMLRLHALWSRELLQPVARSWWHTSGLGPRVGRSSYATWHGAGLSGLALGAFGFFLFQLLAAVVSWGGLFPYAATYSRPYLHHYRRRAREWTGVEFPAPYRPLPEPPVRDPDGMYRVGRSLHSDRMAAARSQQYNTTLRDPATWRDLLWTATGPLISLIGLVPAILVGVGFFGLFWQPLWWAPWAVPIGLATGEWVTPWYVWYAVTHAAPSLSWIPGWVSPFIGLALAAFGVLIARPLLRLRIAWDRLLLAPTEAARLAQRVRRLTETRTEAVDARAAELRRIERDLHDGAQARLVALGMSLGAIEELIESDPEAARALVTQARANSATALSELRDLVRGIHPPVLAERGLGDAVRAVALDSPLPVDVTVAMDGRLDAPVEAAAYFSVSEALANAIRHSGARRVGIDIRHSDGVLRMTVTDDGQGGADPARGGGLRGVQRRLGTFDGALAVQSPLGGPTVIAMEVPCALSSPRTSTS